MPRPHRDRYRPEPARTRPVDLDLGIRVRRQGLEIAAVEGVYGVANHVNVFPPHRLLRQPHAIKCSRATQAGSDSAGEGDRFAAASAGRAAACRTRRSEDESWATAAHRCRAYGFSFRSTYGFSFQLMLPLSSFWVTLTGA